MEDIPVSEFSVWQSTWPSQIERIKIILHGSCSFLFCSFIEKMEYSGDLRARCCLFGRTSSGFKSSHSVLVIWSLSSGNVLRLKSWQSCLLLLWSRGQVETDQLEMRTDICCPGASSRSVEHETINLKVTGSTPSQGLVIRGSLRRCCV